MTKPEKPAVGTRWIFYENWLLSPPGAALNFPEVGRYLTGPEFRDCAEPVVGRCSAIEVGR
jgi:hypothetical protein